MSNIVISAVEYKDMYNDPPKMEGNKTLSRGNVMSEEFLWSQFIKLGEMLGDGLGDEPDGKWIKEEYKNIAITLGIAKPSDFRKPRKNNSQEINSFMAERIKNIHCTCGGDFKQTRSGSLRGKCMTCGKVAILGKRRSK